MKTDKGWRVRHNLDSLSLSDCRPRCGSTKRILAKGQRAVVASIEGKWSPTTSTNGGKRLHYNPFRSDQFHTSREAPQSTVWSGGDSIYFATTLPNVPKGTGARCYIV